ncbi:hypothetical protein MRX96_000675 [Rhipicephalus microplus]
MATRRRIWDARRSTTTTADTGRSSWKQGEVSLGLSVCMSSRPVYNSIPRTTHKGGATTQEDKAAQRRKRRRQDAKEDHAAGCKARRTSSEQLEALSLSSCSCGVTRWVDNEALWYTKEKKSSTPKKNGYEREQ